jgi:hypothetical protein
MGGVIRFLTRDAADAGLVKSWNDWRTTWGIPPVGARGVFDPTGVVHALERAERRTRIAEASRALGYYFAILGLITGFAVFKAIAYALQLGAKELAGQAADLLRDVPDALVEGLTLELLHVLTVRTWLDAHGFRGIARVGARLTVDGQAGPPLARALTPPYLVDDGAFDAACRPLFAQKSVRDLLHATKVDLHDEAARLAGKRGHTTALARVEAGLERFLEALLVTEGGTAQAWGAAVVAGGAYRGDPIEEARKLRQGQALNALRPLAVAAYLSVRPAARDALDEATNRTARARVCGQALANPTAPVYTVKVAAAGTSRTATGSTERC